MNGIKPRKLCSLLFLGSSLICASTEHSAFAAYSHVNSPKLVLASNTFVFNPRSHVWKAVQNGKVIRSGRASGGSGYCPDIRRSCRTPTGTYRVISKGGPGCRSSRYPVGKGGAKMPYCMFFSRLYAIHGSYDVPNHNASHGCIRVQPGEAHWLSSHFIHVGTRVVVQSY